MLQSLTYLGFSDTDSDEVAEEFDMKPAAKKPKTDSAPQSGPRLHSYADDDNMYPELSDDISPTIPDYAIYNSFFPHCPIADENGVIWPALPNVPAFDHPDFDLSIYHDVEFEAIIAYPEIFSDWRHIQYYLDWYTRLHFDDETVTDVSDSDEESMSSEDSSESEDSLKD